MSRIHECNLPCTKEGCDKKCAWVPTHNTDDSLHLCWRHIKEWEEILFEKECHNGD